jgi:uncharacterized membrane protein
MYGMVLYIAQDISTVLVSGPDEGVVQLNVINFVQWLRLTIETAGALIVGIGIIVTLYEFSRMAFLNRPELYSRVRLTLSRYLGLALEFQLGADILSTAIAPSWDQIGKLAAIAVIRTVLNFFLSREMREERTKTETVET